MGIRKFKTGARMGILQSFPQSAPIGTAKARSSRFQLHLPRTLAEHWSAWSFVAAAAATVVIWIAIFR